MIRKGYADLKPLLFNKNKLYLLHTLIRSPHYLATYPIPNFLNKYHLKHIMSKKAIRVAVTGAVGNIGYALLSASHRVTCSGPTSPSR